MSVVVSRRCSSCPWSGRILAGVDVCPRCDRVLDPWAIGEATVEEVGRKPRQAEPEPLWCQTLALFSPMIDVS